MHRPGRGTGSLKTVTLRLYDTGARELREFIPLVPGKVGIYLCGPTVQSAPHIGHLRSAIAFDVLVRWLQRSGYQTTVIRNVTDIDDKILNKSAEAGRPWWAWAMRFEREFNAAYQALGVLSPDYEPRATGHVPQMIALMEQLVERGHAYTAGEGNVYFDVNSFPQYGALTNQRLEDLHSSEEDFPGKRNPHDFALWKAPKAGEPTSASWETPYGVGRPGWHLECSAMARTYLGSQFDIHGGGLDLRFPHHENEQAQSRAAGDAFANYWLHHGWVTQGGVKMSKSLGNGLLASVLLEQVPPVILRYALTAVQFRSTLEWGESTVTESKAIWDRFSGFADRAAAKVGEVSAAEVAEVSLPDAFTAAMNDDLNVPAAIAVIHEAVRLGNGALSDGDLVTARQHLVQLRAMLWVLGLDPHSAQWHSTAGGDKYESALDELVTAQIKQRQEARAAKDYQRADDIRQSLEAAGIALADSAQGTTWSIVTEESEQE